MIKKDLPKILELFEKYKVTGFINIKDSTSKSLEYSPLHDELSFDSSDEIEALLTIIKNSKKASFKIDSYSFEKLEEAIKDMLNLIDFGESDKDIIVPEIKENIKKDFSNEILENTNFEDLKIEYEKVKNYKFKENIFIELFAIGIKTISKTYINSLGAFKEEKKNASFYLFEIFGKNGNITDSHYKYEKTTKIPNINLDDIKIFEKELIFKISKNKTDFKPGIYDIVLDRDVVIDFLEIIFENMNAEKIRENISMFSKNDIGDKIFSEKLTITNNPELKGYTGNMLFDKEGVNQKKTILIDKGVFNAKFYDYKNALKEGLQNLGNSGVSNIEITGETKKDLLSGNKILFKNLMAFHTVDMITGKFSLNGEGYLLENGEKKDYIKNISLVGNILDLFSSIKDLGNDYKKTGNYRIPSISFKDCRVV